MFKKLKSSSTMCNVAHILKNFRRTFAVTNNQFKFEGDEEILENTMENILMIGINLPNKKNLLTEKALVRLNQCINNFSSQDTYSVAILHGCGGNFCTGIQLNESAQKKGAELIQSLLKVKKPIIGSINGTVRDFGFQLAMMCDMTAVEENTLMTLGNRLARSNIPDIVYKRLVSSVGVKRAMEIVLCNHSFRGKDVFNCGLATKMTEVGSGLGQCLIWAQSIVLAPVEIIIQEKSKIISQIEKIDIDDK